MAQIDHLVDARAEEIVGGGAGEHHGTKLPEIKADALSEREKLYAGMKKISSKINGLRINQGRLISGVQPNAGSPADMAHAIQEGCPQWANAIKEAGIKPE